MASLDANKKSGGTYLKTIATSISLQLLLDRVTNNENIAAAFALPLAPFNAIAQFCVMGAKYSKQLFYHSLFALCETILVALVIYGPYRASGSKRDIRALVWTICLFLPLEMVCLTIFTRSVVGVCANKLDIERDTER